MTRLVFIALLVAATTIAQEPRVEAQVTRPVTDCASDTLATRALLRSVKDLMANSSAPYAALRDSLGFPAVTVESVTVSNDSALCAEMAALYDSVIVAHEGLSIPDRAVIVILVGNYFVVQDPLERAGEWSTTVLLDDSGQFVSIW